VFKADFDRRRFAEITGEIDNDDRLTLRFQLF
jgi:hypothetical protein